MTKIIITKSKNHIIGFEVSGHTGYADLGSDIVCSAVSTATQMTVKGIQEVLKLDSFVEISDGYLKFKLNIHDFENQNAQILLKTMEKTLQEISKEYGQYVKLEVKRDDN